MTSIGDYVFRDCSGLTSVTIPNSVTYIGKGAFFGCENLTKVTLESDAIASASRKTDANLKHIFGSQVQEYIIGNCVTSIGISAFYACSNLTSVTILDGVTSIGNTAFSGCTSLSSVTIPSSMTNLGASAFKGCTGLREIYCYAEEVPKANNSTFAGVNVSEVLLVVPEVAIEKYKAHPVWSKFWIETPTGINEIENGELKVESSVSDCYNLSGLKIVNGKSSNGKLPRGINIIRMSDGTTRKVLKR